MSQLTEILGKRDELHEIEIEKRLFEAGGDNLKLQYKFSKQHLDMGALECKSFLDQAKNDARLDLVKEYEIYSQLLEQFSNMVGYSHQSIDPKEVLLKKELESDLEEVTGKLKEAQRILKSKEEWAQSLAFTLAEKSKEDSKKELEKKVFLKHSKELEEKLKAAERNAEEEKRKHLAEMKKLDEDYYKRLKRKEEQLAMSRKDIEKMRDSLIRLEDEKKEKLGSQNDLKERSEQNMENLVEKVEKNYEEDKGETKGKSRHRKRLSVSEDEEKENKEENNRKKSKDSGNQPQKENIGKVQLKKSISPGGKVLQEKKTNSSQAQSFSQNSNSSKSSRSLGKRKTLTQKSDLIALLRGTL